MNVIQYKNIQKQLRGYKVDLNIRSVIEVKGSSVSWNSFLFHNFLSTMSHGAYILKEERPISKQKYSMMSNRDKCSKENKAG